MFKYGLSCALEKQALRQPTAFRASIEEVAASVARVGYDGVELFIRDPKQYDPARLNRAAKNEGIEYCAIATGMEYNLNKLCLISDDASVRRRAIDRLKEHLDLGAAIGCPVIVGIMRGSIPSPERYDECAARLRDALLELSDYAKECGSSIVVESILRYISNYLNSAPDAAEFLRGLRRDNVTLHIDTHSMLLEDKDLVESVHLVKDIMTYVHFSDSNRRYPGAGNIDFKAIMKALMDVGYSDYITVECEPWPTEALCAQRGLDYMRALENALNIEKNA